MKNEVVTIEVECTLVCGNCQSRLRSTTQGSEITVNPCQKCMDEAYDSGKEEEESEGT